jgi:ferredoxin
VNVFSLIDRLYGGAPIHVEPSLCLHSRSNRSTCQACVEACPTHAIQLGAAGPAFDPLLCKGCGVCEPACPTGAFSLKDSENLLPRLGEGRVALITCAAGPEQDAAKVPCLAGLSPETLAAAASGRTLLLSVPESCAGCQAGGATRLGALVETATRILAAFGRTGTVQLVHGKAHRQREKEKANQMDRRQFLSMARLGLFSVARTVVRPARAPAPLQDLPAQVTTSRRQWLTALRGDQTGAEPLGAPAAGVPFAAVLLQGEGCTGCEACTSSCPTGALVLVRHTESDQLTFSTDRCVACGLCVQACPSKLLSLSDTFSPAAVASGTSTQLATLPVATCRLCHKSFHGTGNQCPDCGKVSWMRSAIRQRRA